MEESPPEETVAPTAEATPVSDDVPDPQTNPPVTDESQDQTPTADGSANEAPVLDDASISPTTAPVVEAPRKKDTTKTEEKNPETQEKPPDSSQPSTSSEQASPAKPQEAPAASKPPASKTATKSSAAGKVPCDVRLDGKTVVITGANQGIGYETALDLAGRGAKLILACRNLTYAEKAKNEILKVHKKAEIVLRKLDLTSLDSVRECAKEINDSEKRLDVLINNAGIMMCPHWKTKGGFDMQLGVNHIGHFLLTNLLLDLLKKSAPSRVVIVSSMAYKRGTMNWNDIMFDKEYDPGEAYCASKLANILHCRELSKRLEGTGVTSNCLHPGVVRTNLFQHGKGSHIPIPLRAILCLCWPCLRGCCSISPKDGAQTSIYCSIAPELEKVTGKYFNLCDEEELLPHALNEEDARKLWNLSEGWVRPKE